MAWPCKANYYKPTRHRQLAGAIVYSTRMDQTKIDLVNVSAVAASDEPRKIVSLDPYGNRELLAHDISLECISNGIAIL